LLALVQRSSGEAMLLDYDAAAGPVRRTPLGFTPPIGSNKGSFTVSPDGRVWAAIAGGGVLRLFDLGDLSVDAPLAPSASGALPLGPGFDPESTRLGIIAILIGLVSEPVPAVSYQVDDELAVSVLDRDGFRTFARQQLPAGAQGLMDPEGIFYYLLPYIEQENIFRSLTGADAEPVLTAGR
jgi:hypothetical protein